jgi:putative transposase
MHRRISLLCVRPLAKCHYGYRRIAQALRRHGLIVNAERALRLMREDNLLALRAKPFVPRTTMGPLD